MLRITVVVGGVNANRRRWYRAGQALGNADRTWLDRLVSRCEPPEQFMRALQRRPDDIKVVVRFAQA